jgi:hypothetical protein
MIPRLTPLLVVAISLMNTGGPLVAIAQEMIADNDGLLKNNSLPIAPNNEQNSTLSQTDALENSTATEIGDLLELYGLDTDGPVCPPCL